MPLAVTHIILTIIALSIYRDYLAKKKFHRSFVIIGGIAGLFPDLDVPLDWVLSVLLHRPVHYHRLFTHALIWPLLLLLIGLSFYAHRRESFTLLRWKTSTRGAATFFFIVAFGWFFHLFLDCSLMGDDRISFIPIIAPINHCVSLLHGDVPIMLDAVILVLWLVHEEVKHRIRDYI